jgi:hypothetical protein
VVLATEDGVQTVYGIEAADGTDIVITDSGFYPPHDDDARLIAAAPDLLAALRDFVIASAAVNEVSGLRDAARAAIAKATQPCSA